MAGTESREKPFIPSHTLRSDATDKDDQKKEYSRQLRELRMSFALTFGTPEGKRVLKWLKAQAGYGESLIGGNPNLGMDVAQGTIYNGGRVSLYTEMRKLIPHEILKAVEFENVEEEIV
jgi:hypothetical protein